MEERLVDDDINKTIVVKRKKDGTVDEVDDGVETAEDIIEEESGEGEEDESGQEVVFALPEDGEENEELADMTPQEAAEFLKRQAEEAAALKAKTDELLSLARQAEAEGNKAQAEEYYYNILELAPSHAEANVAYARYTTADFSDYRDFEQIRETYEKGKENGGEAFVSAIRETCAANIGQQIDVLKAERAETDKAFREKQEVRRKAFTEDRDRKQKSFWQILFPLVGCLAATIVFAVFISAIQGALFLILTIVFGAASAALAVLLLIASNRLVNARHRVKENERLSSTRAGRKIVELDGQIAFLSEMIEPSEEE